MKGELRFFYEVTEKHTLGLEKPERKFHLFREDRGGTPYKSLDKIAEGIHTNLCSGSDGGLVYDQVVLSTKNNSCYLVLRQGGYQIRGQSIAAIDDFSQIGKKYLELERADLDKEK